MRIRPLVGLRSASSMSREVDLPAPFGPRKATVSPARSSSDRPSTALTRPYTFLTFSKWTTGVPGAPVCPSVIAFPSASPARHVRWPGR